MQFLHFRRAEYDNFNKETYQPRFLKGLAYSLKAKLVVLPVALYSFVSQLSSKSV
jgi:hypothetical protein